MNIKNRNAITEADQTILNQLKNGYMLQEPYTDHSYKRLSLDGDLLYIEIYDNDNELVKIIKIYKKTNIRDALDCYNSIAM